MTPVLCYNHSVIPYLPAAEVTDSVTVMQHVLGNLRGAEKELHMFLADVQAKIRPPVTGYTSKNWSYCCYSAQMMACIQPSQIMSSIHAEGKTCTGTCSFQ